MNSIYFAKNALLIRRSLVRAQVEEPLELDTNQALSGDPAECFFFGWVISGLGIRARGYY